MKNWKTTFAGLFIGSIPIVQALINAFNSGQFSHQSKGQILIGIGIIVFGLVSKDHNVTGGSVNQ